MLYIKKLEDIVSFNNERINVKGKSGKKYKYIKVNDVQKNQISSYSIISEKKAQKRMNTLIQKDQIIDHPENHLNSISIETDEFNNAIVSNSFLVLEIKQEYLRNFILYFLNSNLAQSQLKRSLKGNINIISEEDFKKILIPLPNENILKEISNKIKENYDKINDLRENL